MREKPSGLEFRLAGEFRSRGELRLLDRGRDEAPAHGSQALLTVHGDDGVDDLARGEVVAGCQSTLANRVTPNSLAIASWGLVRVMRPHMARTFYQSPRLTEAGA